MLVLGLETSCDESGVALFESGPGLLAHALHSQIGLHRAYGGVVPELASRDHIRWVPRLIGQVMGEAGRSLADIDAVAYTEGPGLAGALLVGAGVANALAYGLGVPTIAVHHLEGHLLSPLLAPGAPPFPFVALLVSGGHTQLMRVEGVGEYALLGDTQDDAAGEAFDKTAKLLGLPYPGGPALAALAKQGNEAQFAFPRPMINSDNLDFSFSGLKTAVLLACRNAASLDASRADIAASFQEAVVEVLKAKCVQAMEQTGLDALVVAGGVGANLRLRDSLDSAAARNGFRVFYPPLEFCTDNGAMIALAGAMRLERDGLASLRTGLGFSVRPRWDLQESA